MPYSPKTKIEEKISDVLLYWGIYVGICIGLWKLEVDHVIVQFSILYSLHVGVTIFALMMIERTRFNIQEWRKYRSKTSTNFFRIQQEQRYDLAKTVLGVGLFIALGHWGLKYIEHIKGQPGTPEWVSYHDSILFGVTVLLSFLGILFFLYPHILRVLHYFLHEQEEQKTLNTLVESEVFEEAERLAPNDAFLGVCRFMSGKPKKKETLKTDTEKSFQFISLFFSALGIFILIMIGGITVLSSGATSLWDFTPCYNQNCTPVRVLSTIILLSILWVCIHFSQKGLLKGGNVLSFLWKLLKSSWYLILLLMLLQLL